MVHWLSLVWLYSLQPMHMHSAHCTAAVQVHYNPYFNYYNPQTSPIPFSTVCRKLHATKQNEKGILVNSLMKTQYYMPVHLSLLVYDRI